MPAPLRRLGQRARRGRDCMRRRTGPREPLTAERSDMGWQTSLEHVTAIADVPGNHFTMTDEHIASTAEAIDTWLEGIEDGARSSSR
jgi:thioesterase domain-containing protein